MFKSSWIRYYNAQTGKTFSRLRVLDSCIVGIPIHQELLKKTIEYLQLNIPILSRNQILKALSVLQYHSNIYLDSVKTMIR